MNRIIISLFLSYFVSKSICYVMALLFAETGIPKSQWEFDLIPLKENSVDKEEIVNEIEES